MSEKLDLFELSVKRGLENYEVPMEEGAWEQFQSHLNTGSGSSSAGGSSSSFLGKFGAAAAILTAVGIFINHGSSIEHSPAIAEHSVSEQDHDNYGASVQEDESAYVVENVETAGELSEKGAKASEEGFDASSRIADSGKAESGKVEAERIMTINQKLQAAADRAEAEADKEELEKKTTTRYVGNSFKLGAPSEFSPNGDGKEDSFLPTALEEGSRFTMTISDDRGNRVFRSSQLDRPWKGMDQSGNLAKEGHYSWEVVLHKDNNNKEIFRGVVRLER